MQWTEADYDSLTWHDNHVHSISVGADNPDHGTGLLVLDIDHILEWMYGTDKVIRFRISPALLRFREVYDLRIEIDWKGATAGIVPFSIDGMHRVPLPFPPGYSSWSWTIPVNWPTGAITFKSPGFTMTTYGHETLTDEQCLAADQRVTSGE